MKVADMHSDTVYELLKKRRMGETISLLKNNLHMDLQNKQITGWDWATALSMNAVVMESLGIFLNLLFGRLAELCLSSAMFLGAVLCGVGTVLYWYSFGKEV